MSDVGVQVGDDVWKSKGEDDVGVEVGSRWEKQWDGAGETTPQARAVKPTPYKQKSLAPWRWTSKWKMGSN